MRVFMTLAFIFIMALPVQTATAQNFIGITASAHCPDSWSALRGNPGVVLGCYCSEAQIDGTVWGNNPYTSDSSICAAARNAGAIPATGGVVWSMISEGLEHYDASSANGIRTRDYGEYGSSAIILDARAPDPSQYPDCPQDLRSETGTLTCYCTPEHMTGNLWGTGTYTDDSSLCLAAVHVGVVTPQGGLVTARVLPGLDAYQGSTRNGVTSADYGTWGGSFDFVHRP